MEIKLRTEKLADHDAISAVIIAAYKNVEYSNHREQIMVERLRNSTAFIPELSIVAEDEHHHMVGHILLTKIHMNTEDQFYEALALAPLSIRPEFQNKGVGKKLILESHRVAKDLGFKFITVLGHAKYYPKFGYELTSKYSIEIPFEISEANSMITFLTDDNRAEITGSRIKYSDEFFE